MFIGATETPRLSLNLLTFEGFVILPREKTRKSGSLGFYEEMGSSV